MIGELQAGEDAYERVEQPDARVVLAVEDVWVKGDRGAEAVRGVSMKIRRGEILGIAGLEGSGQVELVEALAGVRATARGAIRLEDRAITRLAIRARQRRGVGHIPADRRRDGIVAPLSVEDNLALTVADEPRFSRLGVLRGRSLRLHAEDLIERFDVRVPGPQVPVSDLSGGNQQKVVVARELSRQPSLVLTCYPTWGLDFAAAAAVHRELVRQRNAGAAVVLASMDLDELLGVADRIAVMQGGRVTGEMPVREATPERLGLLMGGGE
jgi:simple sugar transport system ATP-binding protein